MIGYIISGGAFLTGVGIAVAKYLAEERKSKKLYGAFNKAVEENEKLFNQFIEEDFLRNKDLSSKVE